MNFSKDRNHLDGHRLLDLYVGASEDAASSEHASGLSHLRNCQVCTQRYEEVAAFFEHMRREAVAEADDVFTSDRLAHQRDRIMRRLENTARPARVLPFPPATRPGPALQPGARRWIATAAAAGLIIGLAAGRFLEPSRRFAPVNRTASAQGRAPVPQGAGTNTASIQASANAMSDEAFLLQIDAALSAVPVAELRAIDDLTPRVHEIATGK